MEQAVQSAPKVVRNFSFKSFFTKAKSLVEKNPSSRQFERIIHEMDSTKGVVIFRDDCYQKVPFKSKDGWGGQNASSVIETKDGMYIPLVPHNDGTPACPFVFYTKNGIAGYAEFMTNQMDFTEVKNLDKVLIKLVDVMAEAYQKSIPVHPFQSFLLEFPSGTKKETINTASLAMCIPDIKITDLDKWLVGSQNAFLDHFLGWNFGDIIRSNKELEAKVLAYHGMMTRDKKRKDSGPGFEVTYRTSDTSIDNHYRFSFEEREISPPYLFNEALMIGIADERAYLVKVSERYRVAYADVENALEMVNKYIFPRMGIITTDYPHPEPFEGSLGWIHTPKNSCYVCLTKEGYQMVNGLRLLKGEKPITQFSSMDMDQEE